MTKTNRIDTRFQELTKSGRKGFIPFIMAGDPDLATAQQVMNRLPGAGADLIELGMPFSDPMADGPVIQRSGQRALEGGMTLTQTLAMVRAFRAQEGQTPVVLMGYYNPVYIYGTQRFVNDAVSAGVDGLLIVDLPPEEEHELGDPARSAGLHMIRLITPTTDEARLKKILEGAGGYLYYVSVTGVTGAASANAQTIAPHLQMIRKHTALPIAVGFGIKTTADVATMRNVADAVIVGSTIVDKIGALPSGKNTIETVLSDIKALAA